MSLTYETTLLERPRLDGADNRTATPMHDDADGDTGGLDARPIGDVLSGWGFKA